MAGMNNTDVSPGLLFFTNNKTCAQQRNCLVRKSSEGVTGESAWLTEGDIRERFNFYDLDDASDDNLEANQIYGIWFCDFQEQHGREFNNTMEYKSEWKIHQQKDYFQVGIDEPCDLEGLNIVPILCLIHQYDWNSPLSFVF